MTLGPGVPAPVLIAEVELDSDSVTVPPNSRFLEQYHSVWALVLRNGMPIGDIVVPVSSMTERWQADIVAAAQIAYGQAAPRTLAPIADWNPLVSVIIATRARPALLRGAVSSILSGDYTNIELIVVDNSPTGDSRATVASLAREDSRITYLWEPASGISRARNAGSGQAAGELLVFTDDDVIVASTWISSMVRTFVGNPTAECVTGLIVPAELETPAQLWIWMAASLSKGYTPRVFHAGASDLPSLFPFRLGVYGSGANLAVRSDVYSALEGFDETLGVGTPARGGEDLDFFLRLMLDDRRLVYEPAAYLRHNDYRRFDDVLVQRDGYGVGLAAVLTKHLMTENRRLLVRLAPQGVWYLLSPHSPKNAGKERGYPRILSLAEFAGLARGPSAYCRSRRTRSVATPPAAVGTQP